MPTYDFKCQDCGEVFDVYQSMFDPNPQCNCGGETEKLISAPAVKMRTYLPLVEQEDGKRANVEFRDKADRNQYFQSDAEAKDKSLTDKKKVKAAIDAARKKLQ